MSERWTLNKLGIDSPWVSPLWGTQRTSRVPSESEQSAAIHHLKAQGQSSTGPQTCDQRPRTTTVTVLRLSSQSWEQRRWQWALKIGFSNGLTLKQVWTSFLIWLSLDRYTYCHNIGTEVAGVCKSIDDGDSWFTGCCQEGAVTSILQREFVWGLAEDTKLSLHF